MVRQVPMSREPRIETDAAMCRCGAVWLTPWQPTFLAEGAEHGRTRCRPEAS